MEKKQRGLVLVNTGNGKGKSTAAFGLAVRSAGNGKKVCILQFIKSPDFPTGEGKFFEKNNIEMHTCGIGFTIKNTPENNRSSIKKAWELAKTKLLEDYDLVILDEINYVLDIKDFDISDIITAQDVIEVLEKRPEKMNVVLTGRNAKEEIQDFADLVTEMRCVKHYYDSGVSATLGIEF